MDARFVATVVFILSLLEASIYAQNVSNSSSLISSTSTTLISTPHSTTSFSTSINSTDPIIIINNQNTNKSDLIDNKSPAISLLHGLTSQQIIYITLLVLFSIIIILCFLVACYVRTKTLSIKRKLEAFELRHLYLQNATHTTTQNKMVDATPTKTDTKTEISVPSTIPPPPPLPPKQEQIHPTHISGTLSTINHPMIIPPPIMIGNINRSVPFRKYAQSTPKGQNHIVNLSVNSTPVNSTPVNTSNQINVTPNILSVTPTTTSRLEAGKIMLQIEGSGHGPHSTFQLDINSNTSDESNESMYDEHEHKVADGPRKITVTSQCATVVQQGHVKVVGMNENVSDSHESEEKYIEPVRTYEIEEKSHVIVTNDPLTIENKIANASNQYKALEKIYHKQFNEKINNLEEELKKVELTDALSLDVQIDTQSITYKKNVQNHFVLSKMPNTMADIKRDVLFPNGKRNEAYDYKDFFSK